MLKYVSKKRHHADSRICIWLQNHFIAYSTYIHTIVVQVHSASAKLISTRLLLCPIRLYGITVFWENSSTYILLISNHFSVELQLFSELLNHIPGWLCHFSVFYFGWPKKTKINKYTIDQTAIDKYCLTRNSTNGIKSFRKSHFDRNMP